GVYWGGPEHPQILKGVAAPGDRIINTVTNFKPVPSDIYTAKTFGDIELYVEFLCSEKTNSGVYLHGLYEVQIWDSYQREQQNIQDICGTIYDYDKTVDGRYVGAVAPRVRAERPTGQWQSFHIWFQAPRFDESGAKIANAKFLRVLHNGVLIHENVERESPTRACMNLAEAPLNPIMLQGDHGPIAFRNIYVRPLQTNTQTALGEEEKPPTIKEPDVIYVPTPMHVVREMLKLAKVTKDDVVYDLGCGDGRIVVTAAKEYGCRGFGFDIDPERIIESRQNVRENNVEHLVTILQKDIFTLDLSRANVVTLYLLPRLNVKLMPQLEKMKPGSRIVSHDFDMKGAIPDQVISLPLSEKKNPDGEEYEEYDDFGDHTIYLWTIPLKKEK
ncbi:MAG: family 16 glycoside hydrolase, partial [Candidatus Hinthialibacter sp.]